MDLRSKCHPKEERWWEWRRPWKMLFHLPLWETDCLWGRILLCISDEEGGSLNMSFKFKKKPKESEQRKKMRKIQKINRKLQKSRKLRSWIQKPKKSKKSLDVSQVLMVSPLFSESMTHLKLRSCTICPESYLKTSFLWSRFHDSRNYYASYQYHHSHWTPVNHNREQHR